MQLRELLDLLQIEMKIDAVMFYVKEIVQDGINKN